MPWHVDDKNVKCQALFSRKIEKIAKVDYKQTVF